MSTALITGLTIGLGIPTLLLLRHMAIKSTGRRDKTIEQHVENNSWVFNDKTSSESNISNLSNESKKSILTGGKKTRKSKKK